MHLSRHFSLLIIFVSPRNFKIICLQFVCVLSLSRQWPYRSACNALPSHHPASPSMEQYEESASYISLSFFKGLITHGYTHFTLKINFWFSDLQENWMCLLEDSSNVPLGWYWPVTGTVHNMQTSCTTF